MQQRRGRQGPRTDWERTNRPNPPRDLPAPLPPVSRPQRELPPRHHPRRVWHHAQPPQPRVAGERPLGRGSQRDLLGVEAPAPQRRDAVPVRLHVQTRGRFASQHAVRRGRPGQRLQLGTPGANPGSGSGHLEEHEGAAHLQQQLRWHDRRRDWRPEVPGVPPSPEQRHRRDDPQPHHEALQAPRANARQERDLLRPPPRHRQHGGPRGLARHRERDVRRHTQQPVPAQEAEEALARRHAEVRGDTRRKVR
mmetsp:Transcript_25129/g.56749  ORF Transcript_25129/g.56749 Transcript_25129/m.56749 type:complete len:251 (-) Transcript_25129:438-1190(-)